MGAIIEAIGSREFLAGLRWGGIAAGVALIGAIIWQRFRREPAPVIGSAVAAATLVAMRIVRPLDRELLVGIAFLGLAGAIFRWTRRKWWLTVLATVPGAWFLANSELPGPRWVPVLVFLVTALTAPIVSWFDQESYGWLPTILFAIAAAGVFVTVPDTEEALVLVGALAVPGLLALPRRFARIGAAGSHALIGVFLWVIAGGGRGRGGSVVGAVAALGMLVVAPIGAHMARKQRVATDGWPGIWLVVLQLIVVAVTTRVAGLQTAPIVAASIALPTLLVGLLFWTITEKSVRPRPTQARTLRR